MDGQICGRAWPEIEGGRSGKERRRMENGMRLKRFYSSLGFRGPGAAAR